jgi:hypothetical protein
VLSKVRLQRAELFFRQSNLQSAELMRQTRQDSRTVQHKGCGLVQEPSRMGGKVDKEWMRKVFLLDLLRLGRREAGGSHSLQGGFSLAWPHHDWARAAKAGTENRGATLVGRNGGQTCGCNRPSGSPAEASRRLSVGDDSGLQKV